MCCRASPDFCVEGVHAARVYPYEHLPRSGNWASELNLPESTVGTFDDVSAHDFQTVSTKEFSV